jgi:hypothetical protein
MHNPQVRNQLREIHILLDEIDHANRLRVHWGRYLCVMTASFLENAVQAIYEEYAYTTFGGNLANYVSSQIAFTVGNANADSITRTAKSFSEIWSIALLEFLADNDRQAAINTVVSQRNLIAHGEQSAISPAQLKSHLEKIVEVVEFIENQCLEVSQPAEQP